MIFTPTHKPRKRSKKQRLKQEALLKEQKAARKALAEKFEPLNGYLQGHVHRSQTTFKSVTTASEHPVLKDNSRYTGDRLIGISLMHKSNLVPVFSKDEATDLANMRR
jgi:hypothetical protein